MYETPASRAEVWMPSTVKKQNVFSLGSQIGGADAAEATEQQEQEIRDALNRWTGDYTGAIREFAFLLRVDGEVHTYTEVFKICGAQKARRKRDWIEVEIGVPESWWRQHQGESYKSRLAEEIAKGLRSMIELLQRNRHDVRARALLDDWEEIKRDFLRGRQTD